MMTIGARASEGRRGPRVVRLGEEFLEYCGRVDTALRGRWAAVNDHLQRAAASILANTGEALDEISTGDRSRLFRYALRSCGECERCLRGLQAVDAIPDPLAREGLRRVRDVKMDLFRLVSWSARTIP
jgi:four helix bundle protein